MYIFAVVCAQIASGIYACQMQHFHLDQFRCLARSIPESWLPGSLAPWLPGSLFFFKAPSSNRQSLLLQLRFPKIRLHCNSVSPGSLASWLPDSPGTLVPLHPGSMAPWLPGSWLPGSPTPQPPGSISRQQYMYIYICSHFDSSSNSSRYYNVQYHLLCIPEVPDGNGSSSHAGELVCFEEVLRNDEGAATKERSVCCSRADNNYNLRGQMHLDGVK